MENIKFAVKALVETRKVSGFSYTPRSVLCKALDTLLPFKGYGMNPHMASVTKALRELYGESYTKVEVAPGKFRKAVKH